MWNNYLVAIGLDCGLIYLYNWCTVGWKKVSLLSQRYFQLFFYFITVIRKICQIIKKPLYNGFNFNLLRVSINYIICGHTRVDYLDDKVQRIRALLCVRWGKNSFLKDFVSSVLSADPLNINKRSTILRNLLLGNEKQNNPNYIT